MKHTFEVATNGKTYTWEVELPEDTSRLVKLAVKQGFQKWITDAGSTAPANVKEEVKKKAPPSPDKNSTEADKELHRAFWQPYREAAITERYEAILNDTYLVDHTGKTRLSPEDFALRAVLNSKLKMLKGESVEAQLTRYTKELAKKQSKEFAEEMTAKVKASFEKTDLYKKTLAARKAGTKTTTDEIEL